MYYPSQDNIFDNFPVIELDNIRLRKISPEEDYQKFFQYVNSPMVAKYLSMDDLPKDLEGAKKELYYWSHIFDYRHSFYWAIALKNSNEIIGTCGFNYWNRSQGRAEISYDLDYNHWNKGITTKAIKAITNFGLHTMQVKRIQATVALDNNASMRVLEKAGFSQESILRKYGILQEESRDFYMYAKFD